MSRATEMWVVYLMVGRKANGMKAVCLESEWNDLEMAKPGEQLLVKKGIASESEAELLARGTSGDSKPRGSKLPPVSAG